MFQKQQRKIFQTSAAGMKKKKRVCQIIFFRQLESSFKQIAKSPEAAPLFDAGKRLRCFNIKRFS